MHLFRICTGILLCAGVFIVCITYIKIRLTRQDKLPENLMSAPPEQATGIIFGRENHNVVFSPEESEGSVGVFSASGTGKTAAVCIPTLRAWQNGTAFVIDISGDICSNCPEMKNRLIYDPASQNTAVYNVFGAIDRIPKEDEQNEALEQLAFLIMPDSENMNDNARFFAVNGRKILTASLIAFYHAGYDFPDICRLIVGSGWQELFRAIDATKNEIAMMLIGAFEGTSEANTAGCKQSADEACKLFATNAKIAASVRRPIGDEKSIEPCFLESTSIFVIIDDPFLKLYAPVLHIITAQVMQYISNRDFINTRPILLCLDEFASLGKLEILDALRKFRKRHCRILLMTQNLADLELIYGKAETRAMLANLQYKVLLGGLGETESQEYFAQLIGYKTGQAKSITQNGIQRTTTISDQREYIIEPADLDRLGDKLVLICPGKKGYMLLQKNYYFK